MNAGAGGGAGGLIVVRDITVPIGSYTIKVGNGGAGGTTSNVGTIASNGIPSSFDSYTVIGGGAGVNSGGANGNSGGCGGGAGNDGSGNRIGGAGTPGQGFKGGDGTVPGGSERTGGGGGGAGAEGQASVSTTRAGNGGVGQDMSSIFGTSVGQAGWFAGGGGGGVHSGTGGTGGNGGGGSENVDGLDGTGGGGGAGRSPNAGRKGGTGIVIVRYRRLTACTACVAGKYKIATGTADCTDCATGKYSPTAGATLESTCVVCPGNSNSPSASTAVAACTCNAGSTGPDGGLTLTTDSTNLVAWYKLNGDLIDSTGRTGSLINAGGTLAFAQDTTLNSNLPYSWYAVGSGTSNLNYARSPVINRNVPLSFAFWFKTTGSGVYTILSYGDKSVENPSIQFDWNGGQLSVATALSAQWTIVPLTTGLVVNTWYFVVYTLSNANPVSTILYVDGTQRATGTGSTGQTLPRFKDLTVANSGDTGRGFAGHIGDIRIYDKVLIQAEITSLFTNMPTPCTTCAAGKYKTATGSAACTDCLANTFSSVTGATSSAVCASCATGFSPAVSGAGLCTATSSTLERSCGSSGTDACTASQSSAYDDVNFPAYKALDGNLDTITHTNSGGLQWWRLDFGRSVSVSQVIVYNRKDCCQFRLAGFKIAVGDSPSVDVNAVCASNQPAPTVSPFMAQVTCPTPLIGRYLHISVYAAAGGSDGVLSLGEVQVTGCPACQVVCAAGTYRVASACVNCATGKYSATTGATAAATCLSCPANANSLAGSTAAASCTCNPGYALLNSACACDLGYEPGA